jgi:hypothetical protein
MKKLLSYAAAASLLIASCTDKPVFDDEASQESVPSLRACAAMEVPSSVSGEKTSND